MANKGMAIAFVSMMASMAANAADAPPVAIPPDVQVQVKALGCDSCHGWERTKFGPSWQNVADRYRGKTTYVYKGFNIDSAGEKLPMVQGLVKKISKGGKGEWNEFIPMVPNDIKGDRQKEITNIVNFILSIPPNNK